MLFFYFQWNNKKSKKKNLSFSQFRHEGVWYKIAKAADGCKKCWNKRSLWINWKNIYFILQNLRENFLLFHSQFNSHSQLFHFLVSFSTSFFCLHSRMWNLIYSIFFLLIFTAYTSHFHSICSVSWSIEKHID